MTLLEQIMLGTHVALQVLGARLVLVLTLLLTAGAFAWAFWLQTQLACILAAAWAVLVFLPVLYTGDKSHAAPKHTAAHDSSSLPAGTPARQSRRGVGGNSMEIGHHTGTAEAQRELDV